MLKASDFYVPQLATPLSDRQYDVVLKLYQPMIGTDAYSLFMILSSEATQHTRRHTELFARLQSGLEEFQEARMRLEAIGLLQTYRSQDELTYVYAVQAPMSPGRFFNDPFLSALLCDSIGLTRYEQVRQSFLQTHMDLTGYTAISAKFSDVFVVSKKSLTTQMKQQQQLGFREKQQPVVDAPLTFDFERLLQELGPQLSRPEIFTDTVKQSIQMLHMLYGIELSEMKYFVMRAFDAEQQVIDEMALRKDVMQTVDARSRTHRHTELPVIQQWDKRVQAMTADGLTPEEIQVIERCEQLAVFDFLHALRQQQGGYITSKEQHLVKRVVESSRLSPAVINFLIYYVLVHRENATLQNGFVETLANDWQQKQITTPEQAYRYVMQHDKAANERREQYRQAGSYRQKPETTPLPEWMTQDTGQTTQMSPEEERAMRERLNKL